MDELGKLLKKNLNCIKMDIEKRNFDFFGIVLAREGDGKSTLALEMASYMNSDFTVDQVIMTDRDWQKMRGKLKKGMAIIFDEGTEIAFSRDAMKRDVKAFAKEITQIRGIGLFMLFCVSDIRNVDRFLRERRAFALFYIPKRGELWLYRLFGKSPRDERRIMELRKDLLNGEFPKPHLKNNFKVLKTPLWNDYYKKKKAPFMKKERESKLVRRMREKIEKKMEGSANIYDISKIYKIHYRTAYDWIVKKVPKKYRFKDFHGRVRVTKRGLQTLEKKLKRK